MNDAAQTQPNPYVGPRAFEPGEPLYGRARELRDLLGLLVAERIVLLYSPSGAGKTSLIRAALVPALREREFTVLPPMRVSHEPPPGLATEGAGEEVALRQIPGLNLASADAAPRDAGPNRFVLSLLLSLEEALPDEQQLPLEALARMTLAEYLDRRGGDADEVLIFDQFEEILTVASAAQADRAAFFTQVGAALRDPRRWALFAAREDYVASLAPYLRPIPTRLATTFRLDMLSVAGARQAIEEPARRAGVRFEGDGADRLVDDLRHAYVQRPDGTTEALQGATVEPVQLQVVCRRLWERLPAGAHVISTQDLETAGDVTTALGGYYAERVAAAAEASGVPERVIRRWFDEQLITPQSIRGQVLRGPQESQGLPNAALQPLLDSYLIRAETRRGATWYELAHDRLIQPVQRENAAWAAANLSALQRQAELWDGEGRPAGLLLRGQALVDAERWAENRRDELTETDRDFLDAARAERAAAEREHRLSRRNRALAIGATALSIVALALLVATLLAFNRAEEQRRFALANAHEALRNERIATSRELAAAAISSLPVDPVRGVILATHAVLVTSNFGIPDVPAALDALQQAVHASRARLLLQRHTAGVHGIAYSPDGTRIATASEDGTVRVWDATSGDELLVADIGETAALDVAWTPDGARLVSGDLLGEVRVLDVATSNIVMSTSTTGAAANGVAVSPDGALVAAGYDDGLAIVWDAASGDALLRLEHEALVDDVAWSVDGGRLATASGAGVSIWDAESGELVQSLTGPTDLVVAVAWDPDGSLLAAASLDGAAYFWDTTSEGEASVLRGHAGSVTGVTWSPDGTYLATGSADGTARVWPLYGTGALLILAGHEDWLTGLAWSPEGTRLASGALDHTVRVWDVGLTPRDGAFAVDWGADDALLALGGSFESLLWTAGGREFAYLSSAGVDVTSVRFSPDGSLVAVTNATPILHDEDGAPSGFGQTAAIYDTATGGALVALDGHGGDVNRAAWSPDGARVATASNDRTVRVWDAPTGDELLLLEGHVDWVVALAWSPDGTRIASGDRGGLTIVWDAASGDVLLELRRPENAEINSVAWSRDSTQLAVAAFDGQAHILDAATGDEVLALDHPPDVRDVAWSPDGTRIATVGTDKTLRIWDAASGDALQAYTFPAEPYELAYSRDGTRIALASAEATPRIFELDREALLAAARERALRAPSELECRTYRLSDLSCPPPQDQTEAP